MFNSGHDAIVKAAGGEYKGTESGLVWFNAPSGSTLVVEESVVSEESVRLKIAVQSGSVEMVEEKCERCNIHYQRVRCDRCGKMICGHCAKALNERMVACKDCVGA